MKSAPNETSEEKSSQVEAEKTELVKTYDVCVEALNNLQMEQKRPEEQDGGEEKVSR